MQGSSPAERTAPSASAARKGAGTVSRSFESRLCSEWAGNATRSSSSMSILWPGRRPPPLEALDRSGEVGGTSPPRSVGQIESPRYPTEPHFATQSGRKWDTIRRTELLRGGGNHRKQLFQGVFGAQQKMGKGG